MPLIAYFSTLLGWIVKFIPGLCVAIILAYFGVPFLITLCVFLAISSIFLHIKVAILLFAVCSFDDKELKIFQTELRNELYKTKNKEVT